MLIKWLKQCHTIYSSRSPYINEVTLKEKLCGFILRKVFTAWHNEYLIRIELQREVDELNAQLKRFKTKIDILTHVLHKGKVKL